jgi:hypothetical protein
MHAFLFAHIHWLWAILHWLRRGIYAPWTFLVVVFIGIAQTVIAWESGELAVKALTSDLLSVRDRKRYLRLVRILALLLFPATFFVGVVNDRGQRDADEKANQARVDQLVTQGKLDKADERARLYDASFDSFVKSLDQRKLTSAQYLKLVQAQRDAGRGIATPVIADASVPLSLMSNAELRTTAIAFSRRLHADDLHMYDFVDRFGRSRGARDDSASLGHGTPSPASVQRLAQDTQALNDYMSGLMQEDVPLANELRSELIKRIGRPPRVIDFPPPALNFVALNAFLSDNSSYIDELARSLPNID